MASSCIPFTKLKILVQSLSLLMDKNEDNDFRLHLNLGFVIYKYWSDV